MVYVWTNTQAPAVSIFLFFPRLYLIIGGSKLFISLHKFSIYSVPSSFSPGRAGFVCASQNSHGALAKIKLYVF